ncbi:MAG: c-type cytochrome [Bdellovibrionales bacterium]
MKQILYLLILIPFIACAPANGPHKPFSGLDGQANSQAEGYDSVRPIFAKYCAACHPSRSGPDWLDYNQANAYARNGKLLRRVGVERSMPPSGTPQSASLSESERLVIANWARAGGPKDRQTAEGGAQPVSELSEQQKAVQNCLHCHGANGSDPSAQPRIPILAGQNEAYLAAQLQRFKGRERVDPTQGMTQGMNDVAADLSDEQIRQTSSYFASRDAHAGSGEQPLSGDARARFQRGKNLAASQCISCHRNPEYNDRPTSGLVPVLTGQSKIYLANQLKYFRVDERSNPLMREFAKNLSIDDIEALATYFANVR